MNWIRRYNLNKLADMMEVPEEDEAVKAESDYDEAVEHSTYEDTVGEEQEKEANSTYDTAKRYRPGIHLTDDQESKVRHTENGIEVTEEGSGFKIRNQQLAPGSELSDYDKDNQKVAAIIAIKKITGTIPGMPCCGCMQSPCCCTEDEIPGGEADGRPDSDFPPDALAAGREVEMEHTDDPVMATEIAKDHLAENDMYYHHLKHMEDQMGVGDKEAAAKNEAIDILRDMAEKKASRELAENIGTGVGSVLGAVPGLAAGAYGGLAANELAHTKDIVSHKGPSAHAGRGLALAGAGGLAGGAAGGVAGGAAGKKVGGALYDLVMKLKGMEQKEAVSLGQAGRYQQIRNQGGLKTPRPMAGQRGNRMNNLVQAATRPGPKGRYASDVFPQRSTAPAPAATPAAGNRYAQARQADAARRQQSDDQVRSALKQYGYGGAEREKMMRNLNAKLTGRYGTDDYLKHQQRAIAWLHNKHKARPATPNPRPLRLQDTAPQRPPDPISMDLRNTQRPAPTGLNIQGQVPPLQTQPPRPAPAPPQPQMAAPAPVEPTMPHTPMSLQGHPLPGRPAQMHLGNVNTVQSNYPVPPSVPFQPPLQLGSNMVVPPGAMDQMKQLAVGNAGQQFLSSQGAGDPSGFSARMPQFQAGQQWNAGYEPPPQYQAMGGISPQELERLGVETAEETAALPYHEREMRRMMTPVQVRELQRQLQQAQGATR
jgi:hypothetical protein